jgi:hypothetical protein
MLEEANSPFTIHHHMLKRGTLLTTHFVLVGNNMPEIPDFSQPSAGKRSMWLEPSF